MLCFVSFIRQVDFCIHTCIKQCDASISSCFRARNFCKTVYKNFLLHEIYSKAAAGVLLFYTYCMYAENELMIKDEKKKKKKLNILKNSVLVWMVTLKRFKKLNYLLDTARAGKIRFSGAWKSVLLKPSLEKRCAPHNFVLLDIF